MKNKSNLVKDNFTLRAEKLGEFVTTYKDPSLYELMTEGINIKGKVLDVGCGNGLASKPFHDNCKVNFLDITPTMLEKIVSSSKVCGDIQDLPYKDSLFDIVVSRYCFYCIPDQQKMIDEIGRVLKSDGTFIFVEMCSPNPEYPKIKEFYNQYRNLKYRGSPFSVKIPDKKEVLDIFKKHNFQVSEPKWYVSQVNTKDWLKEKQIEDENLKKLNEYFRSGAEDEMLRHTFNITLCDDSINLGFPVIVLQAKKRFQ